MPTRNEIVGLVSALVFLVLVTAYAWIALRKRTSSLLFPQHAAGRNVRIIAWLVTAALCVSITYGSAGYYHKRHAQSFDVVVVRLLPGTHPITEEDVTAVSRINSQELSLLQSLGITGTLRYLSYAGRSVGAKPHLARVVVIMRQPITSEVVLPEPDNADVIYVQDGATWTMYPPQTPTIRDKIRFWPSKTRNNEIEMRVEPERYTGGFRFDTPMD